MRNLPFGLLIIALCLLTAFSAGASDVPTPGPLSDPNEAEAVCPAICADQDCVWSGEWKAGNERGACDCGPLRRRSIPGGSFRSQAGADEACPEICGLQGDRYQGEWSTVSGGFSVCACEYIGDYCEPKP